ncbi:MULTISPECIES: NAD-dependent epimerase/dehydratase family protein [unclassified Mesobacillus]|uniref:NAD-dependent epimerase/dehydratase family protein n=1 Tax=unclassified Mesobacillus TaxID=2675270 RepID=UPI00203B87D8|nr:MULTISPECIES: NAD-dependent epimerase/dehydratase family protein [unclassified Mesobacillus]MCM3124173.1 NAD-dependent epimerase/dehydratase family protein [Mesobacillus sp. MER 33]MCM3234022.1 NAD-dependent epimerase/dehydratase family protein [Mesobacillus sp. MER 48]
MKKILITGTNSYVGTKLLKWFGKFPNKYLAETINLRNELWKEKNFSEYDAIIHTVGIAHIKETKFNEGHYFKINRDLSYSVALKAKNDGVNQFIFLSSMSVYGKEAGIINEQSIPKPTNNYGKSKLQAEKLIQSLSTDNFKVAIVRPPMIYGKGCKGNYQRLVKIALKIPYFPDIKNKRSMIFIENLCEYIRLLLDDCNEGIFLPQNQEYVCTSYLVKLIAEENGKKIKLTKILNPLIKNMNVNTVKKVFGDLYYDQKLSDYNGYNPIPLEESIRLTE